jgi:hypothetical protein
MRSVGSEMLRFAYRLCSAILTLGATGLLAVVVAGDVEWVNACLSVVPWLCAVAAFWYSPVIRWSRWLYVTCRVVGWFCPPLLLLFAYRYYTSPAAQRPGWDGLGDIVAAFICVFVAVLTALLGISASLGNRLTNEVGNSIAS